MRIAIDATPLAGRPTGIGEFCRRLIEHLRPHDVELLGYGLTLRGIPELRNRLPSGVTSVKLPMPAAALLRSWQRWDHPTLEWWTGRVDVVHGTNFVVPPSRKATRIVTVHDLTAVRYPEMCKAATLRYPALIARAIAGGAHVHTPSTAVAEEVVQHFAVPSDRVHAIAHGIVPLPEGPGTEAANGRAAAGAGRYVLAVGTVEPRKDYPLLVRAFDAVAAEDSDVFLVIAGNAGWGSDALGQAIAQSRYSSRIRLLGWIENDTRAGLIRGASALVFPSRYEGFGLPPLEAMQEGIPVVATSAGAVPEVVGDAALVTPVGDTDRFAEAVSLVLSDDPTRRRLIDAGRRRAEKYSWQRCAASFLQLYSRLAEERVS